MPKANFKGDNGPHSNIVVRPASPPVPPTSQPQSTSADSSQTQPLEATTAAPGVQEQTAGN